MLCQNCGINTATTHIKRIVNGEATELHLCSKCAKHLGYGNIFSGFFSSFLSELPDSIIHNTGEKCPGCGTTFDEIAQSGMLGCEECYSAFRDKLAPSLVRIHGRSKHVGKKGCLSAGVIDSKEPKIKSQSTKTQSKAADIKAFQELMQKAVQTEDFEKAAQYRDMIKALKEGGKGNE